MADYIESPLERIKEVHRIKKHEPPPTNGNGGPTHECGRFETGFGGIPTGEQGGGFIAVGFLYLDAGGIHFSPTELSDQDIFMDGVESFDITWDVGVQMVIAEESSASGTLVSSYQGVGIGLGLSQYWITGTPGHYGEDPDHPGAEPIPPIPTEPTTTGALANLTAPGQTASMTAAMTYGPGDLTVGPIDGGYALDLVALMFFESGYAGNENDVNVDEPGPDGWMVLHPETLYADLTIVGNCAGANGGASPATTVRLARKIRRS